MSVVLRTLLFSHFTEHKEEILDTLHGLCHLKFLFKDAMNILEKVILHLIFVIVPVVGYRSMLSFFGLSMSIFAC